MRRATVIVLVLMGGGAALVTGRSIGQCQTARQEHRPDADSVCHPSGGGHGGGGGGGYWSRGTSEIGSVVRGGFGHFSFGRGG